jgi:tetratricopeptide (TPR) repeat protein
MRDKYRMARSWPQPTPARLAWCLLAFLLLVRAQQSEQPTGSARLAQYRNLGKAFYENPTTQKLAVEEFRLALALAPNSVREQVNYGLALLRAGETQQGIAALEKAQRTDPKVPHTWFNLGVALRKQGKQDEALAQFLDMERLVPDEPVTHYQIGSILKAKADLDGAIKEFEIAQRLNPRLAAPHFQLYGLYRKRRPQDAAEELRVFQDLKKQQEGAAIPEDMEWCAYAEIYDPIGESASAPLAPVVYRSETIANGFIGATAGVTAIDLDGGTRPSLIAWSAAGAKLFRDCRVGVADSGLEQLRDVVFIAPGDFDNDGLPDLCVITTRGAELYRNVNGKFRKQADLATGSFRHAVWVDFDHDYDLDLILIGDEPRLLRNNGSVGFSDESKRFPFVKGRALQAVRFDLEPDTQGFDLIASYRDRPGVLYRDRLGGTYSAVGLNGLPAGATNLIAFDFNHDSRTDLAAQPSLLLLNRAGELEKSTPPAYPANGNFVATDFNADGHLDRAHLGADGALTIDQDVTPNYGNWIELALTGVKNIKSAIGAKVEVKAGTSYEKQTYAGVPLVFRLGSHSNVETIRIFWPNGLIQNEINQPVNRILAIKEKPRLAGSCPMIYTWDGDGFSFLTDVLGVAPLGASSGDGQFFETDHQEYVSVPGDALKEKDGAYEVRVTEELREVSFMDQIKLQAVDHPAAIDIVSNEKFKSPPYPEFRLFGVTHRIHPVSAHDQSGADVLPKLLKRDFIYPDFRRTQTAVAELHSLDLDFGKAATSNYGVNHAVLILDGWLDWPDGSTFLAASQEHKDLIFPYLQVKDAAGNWKTVVQDMGMPSGRQKLMAVDLAGKFLSSSREVRIVTNLCLYWDEIFLIEDGTAPPVKLTTLPMQWADLHFRGFSRAIIPENRMEGESFDYNSVSATTMWNPTPGNYTRYGDVRPLLSETDDRMAIMGSGDEIQLRFSAAGLPPLPEGWKRDFLLLVDGWAKDADANTAFSQTVLPMPFHAMSGYPYPAGQSYPHDPVHDRYQKEYNTRPALRLIRSLREGE